MIQFTETTTSNNQYPVLTSSRKGIFLQEEYFNRNIASDDNTGYNIVPRGYFTYRHMSDDAVFYFNINNIVDNGIVSTLYPVFKTNIKLDQIFLKNYLNYSNSFAKYCLLQKQGGSRTYMYYKKLCEHELYIPNAIEEQIKISNFITKLDKKIEKQEQLVNNLKKYKRGLLNSCMPSKESLPKFNYSMGIWKEDLVSNICSISTGKSNTQDKSEFGKYKFYVRSPKIERSNKFLYDEEAVLTVGDGVGTGKVFHYVNGKYDLHQRVYRMHNFSENVLPKYFYYYFSKNFYKRVMSMTAKSSVDSVRLEMIANMKIVIPKINEQKQIIGLLEKIDKIIELNEQRLEVLNNQKKGLLQHLFI